MRGLLEVWLEALADPLDRVTTGDARAVAELIASSLGERPTLRRLLELLHHTFEQNVDREAVRSFKLRGAADVLKEPELYRFHVEFVPALSEIVRLLLAGWAAQAHG